MAAELRILVADHNSDAAGALAQLPWGCEMLLVALSGWEQGRDRARAREAGFDYQIAKPQLERLTEPFAIVDA